MARRSGPLTDADRALGAISEAAEARHPAP